MLENTDLHRPRWWHTSFPCPCAVSIWTGGFLVCGRQRRALTLRRQSQRRMLRSLKDLKKILSFGGCNLLHPPPTVSKILHRSVGPTAVVSLDPGEKKSFCTATKIPWIRIERIDKANGWKANYFSTFGLQPSVGKRQQTQNPHFWQNSHHCCPRKSCIHLQWGHLSETVGR